MKKFFTLVFFSFIFLGIILRLYKVPNQPFYDWDEGIYAQVAKEILKNKSIDTTFNGNVWLDKTPLSYILIAFSFKIFGFKEFYARLIFTILGFLLLYFLYELTKIILKTLFKLKNSSLSLIPPLILSSTPIFLEKSTTLNTDIIIALSWIGYFLFLEKPFLKTIFLLLGVWSKSLIGFYPLFIEPFRLLKYLKNSKKLINEILILIGQILIACLWYFYAYFKYGDYFVRVHFLIQMFKRIYVPIELHFGNKWFYFKLIWENLNFISLFILLSLIPISLAFLKKILRLRAKVINDKSFTNYLILFSPLPFLILLTIVKTKLGWYTIFILPLLSIYPAILLAKTKNRNFRLLIATPIIIFSLFQFVNQTYLFSPKIEINEKIKLARCLNQKNIKNLAFLVDEEERKIKNVLEAAHLQTENSFVYGGSPSFVFYLDKPLKYFYETDEFNREYKNFQAITLSKEDFRNFSLNLENYRKICETQNWLGFSKK